MISLPQAVLFQPGKCPGQRGGASDGRPNRGCSPGIPNQISLGGHADLVPIHNRRFRNNWELAAARSLELLTLLTTRHEIAESRFSISSYGSKDPRNSNETPNGRASNRRVEILILDETPPPEQQN